MAIEFTATFNPSPTSYQFSLATADDPDQVNLFTVTEATDVQITLIGGSFPVSGSPAPIVWTSAPDSGATPVVSGPTNNVLSFRVSAPIHVLSPWVFRFIANVDGVNGVRSQNIYLAKPISAPPADSLQYSPDSGNFSLLASPDPSQVGLVLGEELLLVNAWGGRSFSVNLVSDPSSTSTASISFATENAIVWSSGEQPTWILPPGLTPSTTTRLDFTIGDDFAGQSIGLQFAIMVTPEGGEPARILSPDPILINATIGDGG